MVEAGKNDQAHSGSEAFQLVGAIKILRCSAVDCENRDLQRLEAGRRMRNGSEQILLDGGVFNQRNAAMSHLHRLASSLGNPCAPLLLVNTLGEDSERLGHLFT